jgi:hypothetical protein
MTMTRQKLQDRLQATCDGFAKSGLLEELQGFVARRKEWTDGDETESVLQMLGLLLLTAVQQRARRIALNSSDVCVLGGRTGVCATLPRDLLTRACEVVNEISGVEEGRPNGTFALGLHGRRLSFPVERELQDVIIHLPFAADPPYRS